MEALSWWLLTFESLFKKKPWSVIVVHRGLVKGYDFAVVVVLVMSGTAAQKATSYSRQNLRHNFNVKLCTVLHFYAQLIR